MSRHLISFTVNGDAVQCLTEAHTTLCQLLREELGFTDVKESCQQGDCGACAVLVNGIPVNSCLVLAAQADGGEVVTPRGLSTWTGFSRLQEALLEHGAVQCGYCTPGVLVVLKAFLDGCEGVPTEDAIRKAIAGNICRCGGYNAIVRAVLTYSEDSASRESNP